MTASTVGAAMTAMILYGVPTCIGKPFLRSAQPSPVLPLIDPEDGDSQYNNDNHNDTQLDEEDDTNYSPDAQQHDF